VSEFSAPSSSRTPPRQLTYQHLEKIRAQKGLRDMVALYETLGYKMSNVTTDANGERSHPKVTDWKNGKISHNVIGKIQSKIGLDAIDWNLPIQPPAAARAEEIAISRMHLPELYDVMKSGDKDVNLHHLDRVKKLIGYQDDRSFTREVLGVDDKQTGLKARRGGKLSNSWRGKICSFLEKNHADQIKPASSTQTRKAE
jgi:hypothetical protein